MKAVFLLGFLLVTVMCKPIDYEDVQDNTEDDVDSDTDTDVVDNSEVTYDDTSAPETPETPDTPDTPDTSSEDATESADTEDVTEVTTEGLYEAEDEEKK